MKFTDWVQFLIFAIILFALIKPLGLYMARVYQGQQNPLERLLRPLERWFYRLAGVDPEKEMDWKAYTVAVLLFNLCGFLFLYLLLRLQAFLPLNPQRVGALSPDLSFNSAVSFVTNTNWQAYGGETTLSYLTQMMGMGVQNFLSAATGADPPTIVK